MANLATSSPPGWETWVETHKGSADVDNAFALAWFLHDSSTEPDKVDLEAACRDFKASDKHSTYLTRYPLGEQSAATPPECACAGKCPCHAVDAAAAALDPTPTDDAPVTAADLTAISSLVRDSLRSN